MTELKHSQNRNYGIDALRIYAMFLVVILHVLGHGGVLDSLTGISKYAAKALDVFAVCAVDIYAIVSGFVGFSNNPKAIKTSKFLTIWTQVFTYSFVITLCAFFIKSQAVGIKNLIRTAFPIATNQYWYFSSYIVVLLLSPWLNKLFAMLSNKDFTKLAATLFGTFSVFTLIANRIQEADSFLLNWGYSALWLIILYAIGAWIKKCDITNKISAKTAWLTLGVSFAATCIIKALPDPFRIGSISFYTSPTILLIAMAYVIVFAKWQPKEKTAKIIGFFAPAAFGVYLIHDNNHIRAFAITKVGAWLVKFVGGVYSSYPQCCLPPSPS